MSLLTSLLVQKSKQLVVTTSFRLLRFCCIWFQQHWWERFWKIIAYEKDKSLWLGTLHFEFSPVYIIIVILLFPFADVQIWKFGIEKIEKKLIIDTSTKFCIYARRAFRLPKTHQWRWNPKKAKRQKKVRSWIALRTKITKSFAKYI